MDDQQQKKLEQEIHQLTIDLTADPRNSAKLLKLAVALIGVADFSQAQIVLAQLRQLAPEMIEVPYNQAVVAHQLKQDQQAITFLKPLLTTKLSAAVSYLLAVIYFEQKQIQLATAYGLTAVEQRPQGLPENLLLAQIMTKQALWTAAEPYAQVAYEQAPTNPDAAFVLGGCLLNTGAAERGEQLLRQASHDAPQKYRAAVAAIFDRGPAQEQK